MIDLPMVPFYTKFPDIAAVETRSLIIAENKKMPAGIYGTIARPAWKEGKVLYECH